MRRQQSYLLFKTGLRKLLVRDYGTFEENFLGEIEGIESSPLLPFFFDVKYWIHFNLSFKSQQQILTRCLQPVSLRQQQHHGDKPTMSVSTSFFHPFLMSSAIFMFPWWRLCSRIDIMMDGLWEPHILDTNGIVGCNKYIARFSCSA